MYEGTSSIRTRDAIRAGRTARARALADALNLIFYGRTR
jgi:hypothetical protein